MISLDKLNIFAYFRYRTCSFTSFKVSLNIHCHSILFFFSILFANEISLLIPFFYKIQIECENLFWIIPSKITKNLKIINGKLNKRTKDIIKIAVKRKDSVPKSWKTSMIHNKNQANIILPSECCEFWVSFLWLNFTWIYDFMEIITLKIINHKINIDLVSFS